MVDRFVSQSLKQQMGPLSSYYKNQLHIMYKSMFYSLWLSKKFIRRNCVEKHMPTLVFVY